MLPSVQRLKRQEFTFFTRNSAVVYNPLGTLKIEKSNTSKFAVITSSKNQKKAVLRNTLRRRVYACVGKYFKDYPTAQFYGALYVSKVSYTFTYEEIDRYTTDLCKKAFTTTK